MGEANAPGEARSERAGIGIVPRVVAIATLAVCGALLATATVRVARAADHPGASAFSESDLAELARACPCAGPALGGGWRSHSEYVSCVYHAALNLARISAVRWRDALPAVRAASAGRCGVSVAGDGNLNVCLPPGGVIACELLRTAHADDCSECDAALAGHLVRCALSVDVQGTEHRGCAAPGSSRVPAFGRVIDTRSAVDCESCQAKLGSPASDGISCLVADCGPL